MAARNTLLKLPVEILHIIVDFLPLSVRHSLSLVSTLFHLITIRPIYTRIKLENATQVVRCCRTLAANTDIAKVVKLFHISYKSGDAEQIYLSSFYRIIQKGLKAMTELKELRLLVSDLNFSIALNDLPAGGELPAGSVVPNAIQLPKLRIFAGNGTCVPALDQRASLKAVFLSWGLHVDTSPWPALKALQKTSSATLNLLACRRRGWNLDLFVAISLSLRDISMLRVSNVILVESHMTKDFVESMKLPLSRFRCLNRLEIECIVQWYDEGPNAPWMMILQLLRLGETSALLCAIFLYRGISWFRMADNVWIPDPRREEATLWLTSKIQNKGSPRFEPIINYFEKNLVEKPDDSPDGYDRILREEFIQANQTVLKRLI
ncbi:hypothetical protein BDQ17DRAFT_1424807 [Cyathus striatus]|nr:hypothetical protein BDQ17DRAFT_1424807 [Cyathus striatus]